MGSDDITIEILRSIRDEIVKTNERLEAVREELGGRLEATNERLDRVVQEQIRQATAMAELARGQERHEQALVRLVRQAELTNERLDRHEQALGRLIGEVQALGNRMDNVLTGPMGGQVRDHEHRLSSVEARLEALEARIQP